MRSARLTVAFCGIGHADAFFEDVARGGTEVVSTRRFPDHHRYTLRDLAEVAALAARHGATPVTTETDVCRLDGQTPPAGLLALRIDAEPHEPGPLLGLLRAALGPRA